MKPALQFSNKATTPNDSVYNILQAKDSLLDGEFPRVRLDGSDTESYMGRLESSRILVGFDCEFPPKQCKKPSSILIGWPEWIAKSLLTPKRVRSELTSGVFCFVQMTNTSTAVVVQACLVTFYTFGASKSEA